MLLLSLFHFSFWITQATASFDPSNRTERKLLNRLDPDYGRNTEEIILRRGFGYEFHTFVVPDGFVIGLHRIINPFVPPVNTRATVLSFHGITENTNQFLVTGSGGNVNDVPGISSPNLGFEIARAGYDVWFLDQRATQYSSNNTKSNPLELEYWNWSLDEIALYDLPGAIEYIRRFTGRSQIGYIGYSQATIAMFYLLSRVPKYNTIIKPYIAIAPVFFQADVIFKRSVLLNAIPFYQIQAILKRIGGPLTTFELFQTFNLICKLPLAQEAICDPITYIFLTFLSFLVIPTLPNIRLDKLSVYESTSLSLELSSRQLAQLFQIDDTNRPSMIDLTPEENMERYGSVIAPIYDAGRITNPYIAFFSAINDVFADPKDVEQLRESLPVRPVYDEIINDPTFGHSTFVFGDAKTVIKYVTRPVLSILNALN